jgi:hypothetical protein
VTAYYAEGMSLESDTQVGRRLRALRQREAEWTPQWYCAPPRQPLPPRKQESLPSVIAYAVGVLAAGPAVVIATVALYRALA